MGVGMALPPLLSLANPRPETLVTGNEESFMQKGTGWGRYGSKWGRVAGLLVHQGLIVLQTLLFGKISIMKSSCFGQSDVPETQSQRKQRLRNWSPQC